jgi:gliding motility-associated-like protein
MHRSITTLVFSLLFIAVHANGVRPPAGGCVFDLGPDTVLCPGAALSLNVSVTPGAVYTWTGVGLNCTNCTTPVFTGISAGTYTIIGLMVTPDCVLTDSVQITVSAAATLAVSADTTVCPGSVVNITAMTSLPGTFVWSNGEIKQAFADTVEQTTTYAVVYTYGNGCTLTDSVTVTVTGNSAPFDFPDDTELCAGESIQLNSIATPGATYSWTSVPAGFTSTAATPTVTPAATTTYVLTATFGQCTRTESLVVTVYDAMLAVTPDTMICSGESIALMANGGLTGNYVWSTGQATASFTVQPAATTTYSVTFTYGNNQCSATGDVTITVKPGFTVRIEADPDTTELNPGDVVELTAIVVPSQNLSNFTFAWTQGSTLLGSGEMVTVTAPVGLLDSVVNYALVATAPNGCSADTAIAFRLLQSIVEFPTAFTPNGDDFNNVFTMVLPEGRATIDRMQIFNRWGQLVFESTEPNAGWDGRINGADAPTDLYLYKVWWRSSIGALQPVRVGEVTLLR